MLILVGILLFVIFPNFLFFCECDSYTFWVSKTRADILGNSTNYSLLHLQIENIPFFLSLKAWKIIFLGVVLLKYLVQPSPPWILIVDLVVPEYFNKITHHAVWWSYVIQRYMYQTLWNFVFQMQQPQLLACDIQPVSALSQKE